MAWSQALNAGSPAPKPVFLTTALCCVLPYIALCSHIQLFLCMSSIEKELSKQLFYEEMTNIQTQDGFWVFF